MMASLQMQDMPEYINSMARPGINWEGISKEMLLVIISDGMFRLMVMEIPLRFPHKTTAISSPKVDWLGLIVLMEFVGIKLEPICMVIVTMRIMDIQLI